LLSFSGQLVNGCKAVLFGHGFAHGGSVELEPVGIVNDAVQNGVGEGRFSDDLVPFRQAQLGGDQDGGALVSVLDDFDQITALIDISAIWPSVIEDQ